MDVEDEDEVDEHLLLLRLPRRPVTEGDDIAFNFHLILHHEIHFFENFTCIKIDTVYF